MPGTLLNWFQLTTTVPKPIISWSINLLTLRRVDLFSALNRLRIIGNFINSLLNLFSLFCIVLNIRSIYFVGVDRVERNCSFFVLRNLISKIPQIAEFLKFIFWKPKKLFFTPPSPPFMQLILLANFVIIWLLEV